MSGGGGSGVSPRRRRAVFSPPWDGRVMYPSVGNTNRHSSYRVYFVNSGQLSSPAEFKAVAKQRQKMLLSEFSQTRDPMFRNTKKEKGWDNRASTNSVTLHNSELHSSQREYFDAPRQLFSDGTHEPRFVTDEYGNRYFTVNYGTTAQKGIHLQTTGGAVRSRFPGAGGARLPPLNALTLPALAHLDQVTPAPADRMAYTERLPPRSGGPGVATAPAPNSPPRSSVPHLQPTPPSVAKPPGSQTARDELVGGRRTAGGQSAVQTASPHNQPARSKPDVIFALSSRTDASEQMLSASAVRREMCARLVRSGQPPNTNWIHISAGAVLREAAGMEIKQPAIGTVASVIKSGSLLPSLFMIPLLDAAIRTRLAALPPTTVTGSTVIVVDGFPRCAADLAAWNQHMSELCTLRSVLYFKATAPASASTAPAPTDTHAQRAAVHTAATVPVLTELNARGQLDVIDASPDRSPDAVFAAVQKEVTHSLAPPPAPAVLYVAAAISPAPAPAS